MAGRATLTMKKSTSGSAAPSSSVSSPAVVSVDPCSVGGLVGEVVGEVTATTIRLPRDWYQSVLILV